MTLFVGVAVLGGTAVGALSAWVDARHAREPLSAAPDPAQRARLEAWASRAGWRCTAGDDLAIADTIGYLLDLVGRPGDTTSIYGMRSLLVGLVAIAHDGRHVVFEARRDADAFVFAAVRRDGPQRWVSLDIDHHGTGAGDGPGLREGVTAGRLLAGLGAPARLRVAGGWIVLGAPGRLEPALVDRVLQRLGEAARAIGGAPGSSRL